MHPVLPALPALGLFRSFPAGTAVCVWLIERLRDQTYYWSDGAAAVDKIGSYVHSLKKDAGNTIEQTPYSEAASKSKWIADDKLWT